MPTNDYAFTGGWRVFVVPKDVKSITVSVKGAGSGSTKAGRVAGRLAVTPGRKLYLLCGEAGNGNSGSGGKNGGTASIGGGGGGGDGYRDGGGASGGGYSAIRAGSTSGKVLCVAAGAGGSSGDGGTGGEGGSSTGDSGSRGSAGSGATGAATGGTQNQGGAGGTSSSGGSFYGGDPSNTALVRGGTGGNPGGLDGPGGGGGGGGWHPGGGGQAGSSGYAPGGGGGGGSNYVGSLTSATSTRGFDNGHGSISISWVTPAPAIQPPNTPSTLRPTRGTRTRSMGKVTLSARLSDPAKRNVRAIFYFSRDGKFGKAKAYYSPFVKQDSNDSYRTSSFETTSLAPNTHYRVRVYAQNDKGKRSSNYSSTDFYTNYSPNAPVLGLPRNGFQFDGLAAVTLSWGYTDPDGGTQAKAQVLLYNETADRSAVYDIPNSVRSLVIDGGSLDTNAFYLWKVRTRDSGGLWSDYSLSNRFYVSGASVAPRIISPINEQAVDNGTTTTLKWKFLASSASGTQAKADIRYRPADTAAEDFTNRFGTITTPGDAKQWTLPPRTFQVGVTYEWQVRTYDDNLGGLTPSAWSTAQRFVVINTPGINVGDAPILSPAYQGVLGYGSHRVIVNTKGGHNFLGEFRNPVSVKWSRVRDDISKATIVINCEHDPQAEQLAESLRCWQHELKLFRGTTEDTSGAGVWEGPITLLRYEGYTLTIEAQDVMAWVYRRVMRQGYSDAYPGIKTVVDRAARIIINALAIDDPNILPWLTQYRYSDDTRESRVRPDACSTAWEEVDDLAAKGGLDYTVVGRRIVLNDTHRPIGKLPTMTDKDFRAPLVVTEYGMNLATRFWVTNGAGIYGVAKNSTKEYGYVELLSSAYGEQASAADAVLTAAAKQKLVETFTAQADRNISHRYPAPLQVRVPDGTGLVPSSPVSIAHLVPGVWIPLMATGGMREVSQWQKLDRVDVTQDGEGGEIVALTMQPAPYGGTDPDADDAITAEEEA